MKKLYVPEHELTAALNALEYIGLEDQNPDAAEAGEFGLHVREGDLLAATDEFDYRGVQYRVDTD